MAGTWIELRGRRFKVSASAAGTPTVDGPEYRVEFKELEPGVASLLWTDAAGTTRSFRCVADSDTDGEAVVVDGERIPYAVYDPRSLRSASAAGGESGPRPLKAPMPGRVVRVLVAAGDTVVVGQGCVVVEAMKMQNELKAPKAGVVRKLAAVAGETVAAGAVLLVVE